MIDEIANPNVQKFSNETNVSEFASDSEVVGDVA